MNLINRWFEYCYCISAKKVRMKVQLFLVAALEETKLKKIILKQSI